MTVRGLFILLVVVVFVVCPVLVACWIPSHVSRFGVQQQQSKSINPSSQVFLLFARTLQRQFNTPARNTFFYLAKSNNNSNNNENVDREESEEWTAAEIAEVIQQGDGAVNDDDDEGEWMPDREKAKQNRIKVKKAVQANAIHVPTKIKEDDTTTQDVVKRTNPDEKLMDDPGARMAASAYTEEEEDVIRAMGGKTRWQQQSSSSGTRKREPGFLGDCTLQEIATDYSVPVCYLADVLCMWGVPVPINVHDRLGDLVTGEQAFSVLEAINTLDVSALHDRYSNQSLIHLCGDYDIDLSEAFEMAMKEGWSLPFGVQTVLRVEQEEELLRVLLGGVK